MADVFLSVSTNMPAIRTWDGQYSYLSWTDILVENEDKEGFYNGTFKYDKHDNVTSGEMTEYSEWHLGFTEFEPAFMMWGLSVDANYWFNGVLKGPGQPLFPLLLAGPDYISGSDYADVIAGYSGDDQIDGSLGSDLIYGGTGSDFIRGGGGDDYIDGGENCDTAVFSGVRSQYSVTYSAPTGTYIVSGLDGVDSLRSIEIIRFDNEDYSIEGTADYFIEDAAGLNNVVHRFYNLETGVHFYTASNAEANLVRSNLAQFDHEGLPFRAAAVDAAGSTDIFRFYNALIDCHFYTASVAERDSIIKNLPQYNYEGTGFRAYASDMGPQEELYRFYNASTGGHFFTASEVERDSVIESLPQFKYEGIAFYVDVF